MKLRNKLAAITAVAMLAFAGVGFAAWTFTNTTDPAAVSNTGAVTCAIEADDITVDHNTIYLIFDAPTTASATRAAGHGIYWSTSNSTDESVTWAARITQLNLTGSFNHEANDIEGHDVSYLFDVNEVLTGISSTYVSATAGSFASGATGHTSGIADVTAVYTLPTFSYTALVEGYSSIAEMSAMVAALSGASITLSFTFGITGNYTA